MPNNPFLSCLKECLADDNGKKYKVSRPQPISTTPPPKPKPKPHPPKPSPLDVPPSCPSTASLTSLQTANSIHSTPSLPNITEPISIKTQPENNTLYVILPYFNFCHYQRRKLLFLDFVERYKSTPGIAIVIVEAALQGDAYDLPNPMTGIFAHFRVVTQDPIWLKENLINIGVSKLPENWRMMAWVDADITFLNESWVEDTKRLLTVTPMTVIQMFKTASNLGPDNSVCKVHHGIAWSITSGQHTENVVSKSKYTEFHPGFAWACSRSAYESMGGLIDWAILGSGDRHMALALVGSAIGSAPGNIHPCYLRRLAEFELKCKQADLRIGHIEGSILHHWHGRFADRKYAERWNILVKGGFDPDNDITYSSRCGLIQLTPSGKRFAAEIREYFEGRQEDNKNLN